MPALRPGGWKPSISQPAGDADTWICRFGSAAPTPTIASSAARVRLAQERVGAHRLLFGSDIIRGPGEDPNGAELQRWIEQFCGLGEAFDGEPPVMSDEQLHLSMATAAAELYRVDMEPAAADEHKYRGGGASMRGGISELFTGEGGRDGHFLRDAGVLLEEVGFGANPGIRSTWCSSPGTSRRTRMARSETTRSRRFVASTTRSSVSPCSRWSRERCGLARMCACSHSATRSSSLVTSRSVDGISGGRFDFGVGVGWSDEEYAALGVPFARRGARTDEYLRAMKALWSDEEITSFDGEFVSFAPLLAFPKPVQRPHPPIVVGETRNRRSGASSSTVTAGRGTT